MSLVVDDVDCVIGADMQAVRPYELAFAPGSQVSPLAVQDDHRVIAADQDEKPVVRVHAHICDLVEVPSFRQVPPGLPLPVDVIP